MKLKVAAWNMAHWSHRKVAADAWRFLDKEIDADFALLQEAVPPEDRPSGCCVWREIGESRRWGSAVVSREIELHEIALRSNAYPGALTVAEAVLPTGLSLVFISVYGQLDEHGYSITTLHRMLSDLTHLLHGKLRKGGTPRVILGGDLNASPQFDARQGDKSHALFFARLEDFDLVDCQGEFNSNRPRTLRHGRSKVPWVNDYIFASESVAARAVKADVLETPDVLSLSDHNPVVVTFDL
jgi:endonuclease/exonuclease/phosphatase family metal-dependent hydrolase